MTGFVEGHTAQVAGVFGIVGHARIEARRAA
jgi:hypothetical protein